MKRGSCLSYFKIYYPNSLFLKNLILLKPYYSGTFFILSGFLAILASLWLGFTALIFLKIFAKIFTSFWSAKCFLDFDLFGFLRFWLVAKRRWFNKFFDEIWHFQNRFKKRWKFATRKNLKKDSLGTQCQCISWSIFSKISATDYWPRLRHWRTSKGHIFFFKK